jgi:hypothetical protein
MPRSTVPQNSLIPITPLHIVAALVALTETVLSVALIHVSGGVQISLTIFVIGFPVLVASGFFTILWNRAYVLYAPLDYGSINPKTFMDAIRDAGIEIKVVRSRNERESHFFLIDAMADDLECQCVIFMYETKKRLPACSRYTYGYTNAVGGSGYLGGFAGKNRLESVGLVRPESDGRFLGLTEEGRLFAEWLTKRGRKCFFFWTEVGGWGSPEPGSPEEKWLRDMRLDSLGEEDFGFAPY